MTDYRSWRPIHQAMCPEPGPRDVFLLILINGRPVVMSSVEDHARWKHAAERLAREHECHVKVLPFTGAELMSFYGITPEPGPLKPIEEMDPAFRKKAMQNCADVLLVSQEPRERQEALDLLGHLGVPLQ